MTQTPSDDVSNLGIEADASDETRRIAQKTEQEAFLERLGLLPANMNIDMWDQPQRALLITRVTTEIETRIAGSRRALSAADLQTILDPAVNVALDTVLRPANLAERTERTATVLAQALYDALPKEIWHIVVENEIMQRYGGPRPLTSAQQKDVDDANKFYAKLREKNDANDMSAGMAMFMVMEDRSSPDTWEARYLKTSSRSAAQSEVAAIQGQKSFYDALKSLKSESVQLNYRHGSIANYQHALDERTMLRRDHGLALGTNSTWGSEGMDALNGATPPSSLATPDDRKAMQAAVNGLLTDLKSDLDAYAKIVRHLENLLSIAQSVYQLPFPASLTKYFHNTPLTINPTAIPTNISVSQIEAEITAELAATPPTPKVGAYIKEADITAKLDEARKQLASVKESKDISGAQVQMEVFRAHIKKKQPSLSDADVDQVANYILNRTKVDGLLRHAVDHGLNTYLNEEGRTASDERVNNLYGNEDRNENTNRSWNTIMEIARSLGVHMRTVQVPATRLYAAHERQEPNWQSASYQQVTTAYFSLKELMDGKGPSDLSLARRPQAAVDTMRTLGRILSTKYSGQLEQKLIESLPEDQKKKVTKSRAHLAHAVEHMLTGDTPAWVRSGVDRAHARANENVAWTSRSLYSLGSGTLGLGKDVGMWMLGKGGEGGMLAASAVQHHWKDAATITAFSLLGGPVLGVAAWAAMKQFSPASKGDHGHTAA